MALGRALITGTIRPFPSTLVEGATFLLLHYPGDRGG